MQVLLVLQQCQLQECQALVLLVRCKQTGPSAVAAPLPLDAIDMGAAHTLVKML
jgi:hypothetical protein